MPGNCDPGSDGNPHFCDGPDDSSSPGSPGSIDRDRLAWACACRNAPSERRGPPGAVVRRQGRLLDRGSVRRRQRRDARHRDTAWEDAPRTADCPSGSQADERRVVRDHAHDAHGLRDGLHPHDDHRRRLRMFAGRDQRSGLFAPLPARPGGAACASWLEVRDADSRRPRFTNSAGATVAGWTMQNPGLYPARARRTASSMAVRPRPTNSTCQSITAEGPDCSLRETVRRGHQSTIAEPAREARAEARRWRRACRASGGALALSPRREKDGDGRGRRVSVALDVVERPSRPGARAAWPRTG